MSNIKRAFKSRFDDGYIVEADFSQIEVVVQAYLSGDKKLMQDIIDGVDFHSKRLGYKLDLPYEEVYNKVHNDKDPEFVSARRKIKTEFSFPRAYGAGAASISHDSGMPIEDVKRIIQEEEIEYPGVAIMQQAWIDEVARNRRPTKRYINGEQVGVGWVQGITGARYVFYEDEVPDFVKRRTGRNLGFKPTTIKNYPIQGFAGELLKVTLAKLRKVLLSDENLKSNCLLINTVHDSILFDVKGTYLDYVCRIIKEVMEDAPKWLEEYHGIKFDLPINVETEYGRNWKDMEIWSNPSRAWKAVPSRLWATTRYRALYGTPTD